MGGEIARTRKVHQTEAARVVVDDARPALQMEDDMVMRGVLRTLEMKGARGSVSSVSMRKEPDMPRCMISVSPLSSAARIYLARRDRPSIRRPDEAFGEMFGEGEAQARAAQFDPVDFRTSHHRLEAAAHRFDLRQFRHRHGSR